MSRNQFAMQEQYNSLVTMLGSMNRLETLGLSLTAAHEDLDSTIITPAPPLSYQVSMPCVFEVFTRTADGITLSHGGLHINIEKVGVNIEESICVDQMNGVYRCEASFVIHLVHKGLTCCFLYYSCDISRMIHARGEFEFYVLGA